MSPKRRFSDENSESCVHTSASESDNSDIIRFVRKKCKQLVIDDTSDEDQLSEPWIWKEIRNSPKIWNYTKTPGIKEAALRQLGGNKIKLDIFNIIFDNMFWENIVTKTNRYADQIRTKTNRIRRIDNTWFPVDSNEIRRYFALSIIMSQVKKPRNELVEEDCYRNAHI
ncbi:hypothetical protein K0M31_016702 [Melipona bicolor]|uniref:PiggyBac transposable element-derived protein domain-containing protein n=1 Tax=Melipona bicolor TaxID=60889 RepID=A0AA40FEF3_9HYME|nr:hypothetical protein K0M31_016702 [Melipona bicolor]